MNELPVFKFALADYVEGDKRFLPTKAEPNATGYDVSAAIPNKKSLVVKPGKYVKIELGFRAFLPEGWWYRLNPRSSAFLKKSLHCLYGVIDQDFSSTACYVAQYSPDPNSMVKDLIIEHGERIGQIIPIKRQDMIVEEVSNDEIERLYNSRNMIRTGVGFGSTGK